MPDLQLQRLCTVADEMEECGNGGARTISDPNCVDGVYHCILQVTGPLLSSRMST